MEHLESARSHRKTKVFETFRRFGDVSSFEADAESRTKTNLVVEAVAKAEGFEASAEEIEAEVTSLATDYNMEVERVRQLLSEDMLKHDIAIKKAVEVITSTAKVK